MSPQGQEVGGFPCFDNDVIDVSLDRSADVLSEHMAHAPLVCSPAFLKPNGIVV
jgi:hypothetical protein